MAIDTSLLQFTPVKPAGADPLATLARYNDLQNSQVQQQSNQLDLAEKQRQISRSKALDDVYTQSYGPTGLDIDKFTKNASSAGLGALVPAVQEHYATFQKTLADTAKLNADAQEAQTKAATAQADAGGLFAQHLADPTVNYDPHAFLTGIKSALDTKAVTPQAVGPVAQQVLAALQQDPTGASAQGIVKQWATGAIAGSPAAQQRAFEERKTKAAEQTAQSKADQVTRESDKDKAAAVAKASQVALTTYALSPKGPAKDAAYAALSDSDKKRVDAVSGDDDATLRLGMTPAEIAADVRGKATAANTARHEKVMEGFEGQNVAIARAKQTFDQGAIQQAASDLAHGDLTRLKDIASLRGDQRLQIYNIAKKLNPNFSVSDVDRRVKMEDYMTTGKGGENLQSFGTFLQHAGAASDAVQGIRLSDSPAINKPINYWRTHFSGDPNYTSLIGALEPVRKEAENFLLNGHAQLKEDKDAANKILSDDSSPAQIQEALKRLGHTAEARFSEMNFRYKKLMGKDIDQPFSPEAMEGAHKIGSHIGEPSKPAAAAPVAATPATNTGLANVSTADLLKQLAQ